MKYLIIFREARTIARTILFDSAKQASDFMKNEIEVGNCLNKISDYSYISLEDYNPKIINVENEEE